MNNLKKLSIILLLSLGVSGSGLASGSGCGTGCNTGCNTSNNNCNTGCNNDCNTSNNDCGNNSNSNCCYSTVFVPRSITQDLGWRNGLTFYNRYHDARCNFFTFDNAFIYSQSRRGKCLGAGFLGGSNPITVAQTGGQVNSLNLGLGSSANGGFSSTFEIRPRREVFAWLPQFIFNLDCLCTGLWGDISFAVVRAKHDLRFCEDVTTPGSISGEPTDVTQALKDLNAFSNERHHTGVDNVLLRLGYDYTYCANDHVGIYFLGLVPTGRRDNNARWFEPAVGSKHGGVGVGIEGDWTIYSDDCANTDLTVMTELMYTYVFKHRENRVFDLNNGPLSRFLLAAPSTNPCLPTNIVSNLTACARVEPRSKLDWWLGLHYNWCNFGIEFDYNLFWRQHEKVCASDFNFGNLGIYDQNCGCGTSDSTATIGTDFGAGTPDASFVELTAADVNVRSAAARKALSNTVSGAVSYSNVWCDQYPWMLGFGARYEFASKKYRCSTLEGWGVFGKATISF